MSWQTVKEIADKFNVSESHVGELCRSGALLESAIYIGGAIRINDDTFLEEMREHTRARQARRGARRRSGAAAAVVRPPASRPAPSGERDRKALRRQALGR